MKAKEKKNKDTDSYFVFLVLIVSLFLLCASRHTMALSSCAYSQFFIFKIETVHRAWHLKAR